MDPENMIKLNEFCSSHAIEISFVQSLEDQGLIEIIILDQVLCIPSEQLPKLEKIVRLYREFNINLDSIDIINHLLHRIEELQHENMTLRNQVNFYRDEEN